MNYLIDPRFNKVNRLFFLLFESEEDRTSFLNYYTPKVDIIDFNVLIDGKRFFDLPIKNNEESYEEIIEMSKNNVYVTGNLLDYEYFSNHNKLITIDLSKQVELENPDLNSKLISLVSLKKIMEQQCISSLKNQKEQLFVFHKILWVSYKMETQKIINLLNDSSKR